MITFTLVAILGFLLVLVLIKLAKKPPALPPGPALPQLADLTAVDAQPGDSVSVSGAGDDFSDLDFTVERRVEFRAGRRRWFELSGAYRERRVALEVSPDEDQEVWAVDHSNPVMLNDLGLSEEDLAAIDERQNTGDHFEFDGKLWHYRFSREVTSSDRPPFYAWRFQEEGGKRSLTIRKFEGEPFAAVLANRINRSDVSVFRK